MTLPQLLLFAWVAAWVFAETLSPDISYMGKIQASVIATFAAGYANDAHRKFFKWVRSWK